MKRVNIIMVFDQDQQHILMCKRKCNPYEGLFNLVGGKVERNEKGLDAAYRELVEESGITNSDIKLVHFMDFHYYHPELVLEVYVGVLDKEVKVQDEKHPLAWKSVDSNFFDTSIFAGEGNVGHIMKMIKKAKLI